MNTKTILIISAIALVGYVIYKKSKEDNIDNTTNVDSNAKKTNIINFTR
jgi:hypothetical protein